MHTGAVRSVFADLSFHALAKPWVIVDEVRHYRLQDEQHGLVEGQGTRLLRAEGAEAGVFFGDAEVYLHIVMPDHSRKASRSKRYRVTEDENVARALREKFSNVRVAWGKGTA